MFLVRLCNSLPAMVLKRFREHKIGKEYPTAKIHSIPPVLHFVIHFRQLVARYVNLCLARSTAPLCINIFPDI